jgi:5-methylcytosine-specific restriction endonuclease McrA
MTSALKFPKPTRTLAQERRRDKEAQKRLTAAVRATLARRDGRCRLCGKRFSQGQPAEMHHLVFRSAGGETSTQNTLLLCRACHHQQVHARRVDLVPADPDLGADGVVEVQPRLQEER